MNNKECKRYVKLYDTDAMLQTDKIHPDMFYETRSTRKDVANSWCCWLRPPRALCLRYGFVRVLVVEGAEDSSPDVCLAPTSGSSPRQVLLIRLKGHLHLPRSEKTSPTPWFLPVCRTEPIHCFLNMFIC